MRVLRSPASASVNPRRLLRDLACDQSHACFEPRLEIARALHAFGEGLEGKDAAITAGAQRLDLGEVSQDVGFVDEHAMCVLQARQRQSALGDAGDMAKPGALGKERGLAGEVMVECVVHQKEHILAARRIDGVDRLAFRAQRGDNESQRLDEALQPVLDE